MQLLNIKNTICNEIVRIMCTSLEFSRGPVINAKKSNSVNSNIVIIVYTTYNKNQSIHFQNLSSRIIISKYTYRYQSFTSLKADLPQDINGGFAFSRCLWNISLKEVLRQGFGKLTQKRRFVFVTLLIWVNVPQCLNGTITSRNVPLSSC